MSRRFKIAFPLLLALGVLGYLIYSSTQLGGVACEVCVEFAGRSECRTANATNERDATLTAINNACSLITSGRDELIPCTESPPVSVQCVNNS